MRALVAPQVQRDRRRRYGRKHLHRNERSMNVLHSNSNMRAISKLRCRIKFPCGNFCFRFRQFRIAFSSSCRTLLYTLTDKSARVFYGSARGEDFLIAVDAAHCFETITGSRNQSKVSCASFRISDSFVLFRTLSKLDFTPTRYRHRRRTGQGADATMTGSARWRSQADGAS